MSRAILYTDLSTKGWHATAFSPILKGYAGPCDRRMLS
jgi:hypothetical protein